MRGSVPEATAGRLAIYVGADPGDLPRIQAILAPLGTLRHVGGPGAGAAAKVVVNSTLGAAVAAFGEALALGEVLGLDRPVLLDTLADTAIGSTVKAKRANVESGEYPPNFKLSLALKDLRLVDELAPEPASAWRSPRRRGTGWSGPPRPARATSTTRPCSPPSPATGHRPRHDPAFVASIEWRTLSCVLSDTRSGGVTWPAD